MCRAPANLASIPHGCRWGGRAVVQSDAPNGRISGCKASTPGSKTSLGGCKASLHHRRASNFYFLLRCYFLDSGLLAQHQALGDGAWDEYSSPILHGTNARVTLIQYKCSVASTQHLHKACTIYPTFMPAPSLLEPFPAVLFTSGTASRLDLLNHECRGPSRLEL